MSSEKVKRQLKSLLKHPDNKLCADCPQKKPTWASINLGVFLCLHCAGIHRDMGVHISKVRSVELDTWKPEWVMVMKQWGNRRANKYWEAKIPADFNGRPSEAEAQALSFKLKKFIRDKYEKKLWQGASVPDPEPQSFSTEQEQGGDESDQQKRMRARARKRRERERKQQEESGRRSSAQAVPKTTAVPKQPVEPKPVEEELDLFGSFEQAPAETFVPTPVVQPSVNSPSGHSSKAANIMAMFQRGSAQGQTYGGMANSQMHGGMAQSRNMMPSPQQPMSFNQQQQQQQQMPMGYNQMSGFMQSSAHGSVPSSHRPTEQPMLHNPSQTTNSNQFAQLNSSMGAMNLQPQRATTQNGFQNRTSNTAVQPPAKTLDADDPFASLF